MQQAGGGLFWGVEDAACSALEGLNSRLAVLSTGSPSQPASQPPEEFRQSPARFLGGLLPWNWQHRSFVLGFLCGLKAAILDGPPLLWVF